MENEYYTIEEVRERLKVTRKTIYDWMRAGQLGYVTVGSTRRIPRSALLAFIKIGMPAEDTDDESESESAEDEKKLIVA